jgi:uncharacterized membrane protein
LELGRSDCAVRLEVVISKSVLKRTLKILGIAFVALGVFWLRMWDAHKSESFWLPLGSMLVGVIFIIIGNSKQQD